MKKITSDVLNPAVKTKLEKELEKEATKVSPMLEPEEHKVEATKLTQ